MKGIQVNMIRFGCLEKEFPKSFSSSKYDRLKMNFQLQHLSVLFAPCVMYQ